MIFHSPEIDSRVLCYLFRHLMYVVMSVLCAVLEIVQSFVIFCPILYGMNHIILERCIFKMNAMNKKSVLSFLFACMSLSGMGQGFIHPGILHTQADFDRVKEKLATGQEPWTAAYNKLMTSKHVDLNWKPNPTVKIIRGGWNVWEPEGDNYGAAMNDAATAYQCALVWKITGDERYAEKSVEVMNAWARTCQKVSGNSNGSLASGLYGYEFANAGELMRDYEGWNREDFKRYQQWMLRVFSDQSFGFLQERHGCADDHYWSNWGLCNVLCEISVGILCDDIYVYNAGMEYYKYMEDHRYAETLRNLVWKLHPDERGPFGYFGQMQESNRDQGHASMAVVLAADVCGAGLNQGDDLYAYMDDRIAAGFEYVAAYNTFEENLPNSPYTNSDGTFPEMGSGGQGTNRCGWPRIVNYYENIRGVDMPYSHKIMMVHGDGIDAGGGFYGGNSGGYDHLGFTTLMCSLDPLEDKTLVPTVLKGSIGYDGEALDRTLLNAVPRGAKVTLKVALPDGETDTGKWSWDDDASCTSAEREVEADTSFVYRVRYTNAAGVVSTQMFSIQVAGEAYVRDCTPYCKYAYRESQDTLIYVKKNESVILGMDYGGWHVKSWRWEKSTNGERWSKLNNATTNRFELASVASSAYYRVTMEHKSGVLKSQVFRVEVSEIDPFIIYNGEEYPGTSMVLPRGASFSLYAKPTSILSQSVNSTRIYKWVVGNDTIQADTLTYHLDDLGGQVADLNDTLHVSAMDTSFNVTLVFQRFSSTGKEARTVYHFDVPVYETNVLSPSDKDSYYIQEAMGGRYLRNTDGQFMTYSEDTDEEYLWRIRRLPSTYGSRYMFISRTNSGQHLSEDGRLSSASDYSRHSFNLWHKCGSDDLYAIERSSSASGGLWEIAPESSVISVNQGLCTSFPFRLVKKEDGSSVEDAVLENEEGIPLLEVVGRGEGSLEVSVDEEGLLDVYTLEGSLLSSVRCVPGTNRVDMPSRKGMMILRYVTASGRCKSLKVM